MSGSAPGDNFGALMAAAEQLAPLVEADAKEAEQLSRQTDRVVAALRKAGIADEIVAECGRVLLGITGPTAYWTLFAARGSLLPIGVNL